MYKTTANKYDQKEIAKIGKNLKTIRAKIIPVPNSTSGY